MHKSKPLQSDEPIQVCYLADSLLRHLHSHVDASADKYSPHLALYHFSPSMKTRPQPVTDLVLTFRPETRHTSLKLLSS